MSYHSLTIKQTQTEEDFFIKISQLLIDEYNIIKNEKIHPTIIFLNITIPITKNNDLLYNYRNLCKWFVKSNFKYTFFKCMPFSPSTFYIDHIIINQYFISNDILQTPLYQIKFNNSKECNDHSITLAKKPANILITIINFIINFILYFYYSKTYKIYTTLEFIIREKRNL